MSDEKMSNAQKGGIVAGTALVTLIGTTMVSNRPNVPAEPTQPTPHVRKLEQEGEPPRKGLADLPVPKPSNQR